MDMLPNDLDTAGVVVYESGYEGDIDRNGAPSLNIIPSRSGCGGRGIINSPGVIGYPDVVGFSKFD